MTRLANILLSIVLIQLTLLSCAEPVHVDTLWNKEFHNAQEIADTYDSIRTQIGKDKRLYIKNLCHMIWHSGEYIIKCKGKSEDIAILPQYIDELPLDNDSVKSFLKNINAERFADHYFMLSAMKRGSDFDTARDGLTYTVFFPGRALNNNDFEKLQQVFSSHNEILHSVYLEKMKFPFQNSGSNEGFKNVRPLIEKNVAESPLKQEILSLYDQYETILPGKPAPTVSLKDIDKKEHSFAEFKGKVLVIDVWATWCSTCLAKMPKFMELRNEYKDNPEIEFITVSIDRNRAVDKWKSTIHKRKMSGMLNLIPYTDDTSQFEQAYKVSGVPRYIIIDKEGKIVSAYAPSPGPEMKDIITSILKD